MILPQRDKDMIIPYYPYCSWQSKDLLRQSDPRAHMEWIYCFIVINHWSSQSTVFIIYDIEGTVLDARNTAVNQIDMGPFFMMLNV